MHFVWFAAITASSLLGRLSTRFQRVFVGFFVHSFYRAFMRWGTDGGQKGLACNLCFSLSQRCLMGLRLGLCVGKSSSFTPNSFNLIFMDLALQMKTAWLGTWFYTSVTLDLIETLKFNNENWFHWVCPNTFVLIMQW